MSVSGIGTSSVLQWFQNYLTSAGSATGSQSSCGCQPSGDTTSISQQAVQLNASQASQPTDPAQTPGISGTQKHHHHRHHHGGGQDGHSFVDQLAQSIVSDLQNATGAGATSGAAAPSAQAGATGGSFIDKLASEITNDLLATYQQAGGSTGTPSQSGSVNQVNTIA
jgi:hypothetical protein